MSEHDSSSGSREAIQKIDLVSVLGQFWGYFRRMWWIVVILAVIGAALMFFRVSVTYSPSYVAEATVSVSAEEGANSSSNTDMADQLGKVFPYILSSGALSDIVAEDLGTSGIPGSISVSSVKGTNLLTISVTGSNAEMSYKTLKSVIKNYPKVAQFVVGQTKMTVIEDSGVPKDTGRRSVQRGSMRRGALGGAVIGFLIIIVYMATFRTIRTSDDLKNVLHAPYLGTLPICVPKKRRKKKAVGGLNILDDSVPEDYIDSMRLIRTRVERAMEKQKSKTLMVTSSIPGEGKSTVAVNLALSMAQKGTRVILVDCDLRSPSDQSILNIKGEYPGLRAVLTGEAKLEDSLYQFEDLPLQVLFGSSKPTEQVEILGNERMKKLVDELRTKADIVIFDTPPSAMLVDAVYLVHYIDAALFVVRSNFARTQFVLKGVEELAETRIDIAGCILNGGKTSSAARAAYEYRQGRAGA